MFCCVLISKQLWCGTGNKRACTSWIWTRSQGLTMRPPTTSPAPPHNWQCTNSPYSVWNPPSYKCAIYRLAQVQETTVDATIDAFTSFFNTKKNLLACTIKLMVIYVRQFRKKMISARLHASIRKEVFHSAKRLNNMSINNSIEYLGGIVITTRKFDCILL